MEVRYDRIDLVASRQLFAPGARFEPAQVITRQPKETWLIADGPVRREAPVPFVYCHQEALVRIPLIPYLTQAAPDLAMAFAFSLGIRCASQLTQPIARVHIVTGVPVETCEDGMLRYWAGFGFLLER